MGGGSNSDYNIIRVPSKAEFNKIIVDADLNGTLNSDFDVRKINAWNYISHITIVSDNTLLDHSTLQDNTDLYCTRSRWFWNIGLTYRDDISKNYSGKENTDRSIIGANFRPIIEYRE